MPKSCDILSGHCHIFSAITYGALQQVWTKVASEKEEGLVAMTPRLNGYSDVWKRVRMRGLP